MPASPWIPRPIWVGPKTRNKRRATGGGVTRSQVLTMVGRSRTRSEVPMLLLLLLLLCRPETDPQEFHGYDTHTSARASPSVSRPHAETPKKTKKHAKSPRTHSGQSAPPRIPSTCGERRGGIERSLLRCRTTINPLTINRCVPTATPRNTCRALPPREISEERGADKPHRPTPFKKSTKTKTGRQRSPPKGSNRHNSNPITTAECMAR